MSERHRIVITLEPALYAVAFGAALGFRFLSLGQAPLGDGEARLALQAMEMAAGSHPPLDAQAGYLVLTSLWFFVFGQDNLLARFWPAVAGASLALAPYLFRQKLGRGAALALAFFLAFDPGMVAASRQADGRMLAVAFTVFGLGFLLLRKPIGTGICLGLAVLGGPTFWLGAIGLALGWFVYYALQPIGEGQYVNSSVGIYEELNQIPAPVWNWGKMGAWALGTFLAVGSLLLTQTPALGAAAASLGVFFEGLIGRQAGQDIQLVILAWLISTPLAVVLGITEAVRAKRTNDQVGQFLAWWWVAALLITLVYPARQTADLIWPGLAMLALASKSAVRIYNLRGEKTAFFGQAGLSFALLASMWLSLVGAISAWNETEQSMRLAGMLASFFLLLAACFLIIWGWGIRVAGRGLRFGATLLLVIYTLSTAWNAAGLGKFPQTELWRLDAYPQDADLLTASIRNFSMWKTGRPEALDVTLAGVENPSMQWALRNIRTVKLAGSVSVKESPALVVTPRLEELASNAPYSGQVMAWNTRPDWEVMRGKTWLKWLMFREAPLKRQEIQLWARTDLFPGSAPQVIVR